MQERDVTSMVSVKAWQKPKLNNLKQIASDAKMQLADAKQKPLFDAISQLLKGAVYDIHGDITDQKYRYILDTLMARIRAVLTDKLSDYGTDEYEAINECITAFNKLNLKQLAQIDAKVDTALEQSNINKDEIIEELLKTIKSCNNQSSNAEQHKQNFSQILSLFEKRQKNSQITKNLQKNTLQSIVMQRKITKQTTILQKRQQQIAKSNLKSFKLANLTVKKNINILDDKIKDQFNSVNSTIDSIDSQLTGLSTGSFLSGMFSSIINFILTPLKLAFSTILTAGKWLLKIPMAIIDYVLIKPIKWAFGLLLKPFSESIDLIKSFISNLFDNMKSAAFSVISTFLQTPVGIGIVAFAAGFIWTKWLKPVVTPIWEWIKKIDFQKVSKVISEIWDHICDWWDRTCNSIKYILSPMADWLNGNKSFKEVMHEIWDRFTSELCEWWDSFAYDLKEMFFSKETLQIKNENGQIEKETVHKRTLSEKQIEDLQKAGQIVQKMNDGSFLITRDKQKSGLDIILDIPINMSGVPTVGWFTDSMKLGTLLKAIGYGVATLLLLDLGNKLINIGRAIASIPGIGAGANFIRNLFTGNNVRQAATIPSNLTTTPTYTGQVEPVKPTSTPVSNPNTPEAIQAQMDKNSRRIQDLKSRQQHIKRTHGNRGQGLKDLQKEINLIESEQRQLANSLKKANDAIRKTNEAAAAAKKAAEAEKLAKLQAAKKDAAVKKLEEMLGKYTPQEATKFAKFLEKHKNFAKLFKVTSKGISFIGTALQAAGPAIMALETFNGMLADAENVRLLNKDPTYDRQMTSSEIPIIGSATQDAGWLLDHNGIGYVANFINDAVGAEHFSFQEALNFDIGSMRERYKIYTPEYMKAVSDRANAVRARIEEENRKRVDKENADKQERVIKELFAGHVGQQFRLRMKRIDKDGFITADEILAALEKEQKNAFIRAAKAGYRDAKLNDESHAIYELKSELASKMESNDDTIKAEIIPMLQKILKQTQYSGSAIAVVNAVTDGGISPSAQEN